MDSPKQGFQCGGDGKGRSGINGERPRTPDPRAWRDAGDKMMKDEYKAYSRNSGMPNILNGVRRDRKGGGMDAEVCSEGRVFIAEGCGVKVPEVSTVN